MGSKKISQIRDLAADVVVIGSGGAGVPAALMALENGASVIVLEKRGATGGNAIFANGIFACESPVHRRNMIDVSRDDLFKKAVEWHHYSRINQRVLRAYINKSGDTIRWLMERGIDFEVGSAMRMYFHQEPTWHIPKMPERVGMSRFGPVVRALVKECGNRGATILRKTDCKKILKGADGRVSGVMAVKNGKEIDLKAKSVIIATGGFMGRKDLLKRYFPFYDDSFFGFYLPNTGDGITLAGEAGGAMDSFATLVREACHSSDEMKEHFLTVAAREPYTIWVNKLGRRFIDETAGYHLQTCSNAILVQPDKVGFSLCDDKMVQEVVDTGWRLPRYPNREDTNTYRERLDDVASRKQWVIKSDDWGEIAEWIGAEPDVLKASVKEYNNFCDHGYDEDFVKDRRFLTPLTKPPFYAIKFGVMVVETCGPIRINENMEVIDKDYKPIPGLYAAGVIASGWQGYDYCGDHLFGSALGFSMNSGRIAGENAARYSFSKADKAEK